MRPEGLAQSAHTQLKLGVNPSTLDQFPDRLPKAGLRNLNQRVVTGPAPAALFTTRSAHNGSPLISDQRKGFGGSWGFF